MSTPIINSQMDAILSTVGDINTDLSALKTQAKNLTVKNGTYPEMAAGEIATSMGFTDEAPYLFRKTPNGVRETPTLIGGTVAWNQLASPSATWNKTGGTTSVTDDVCTFTASASNQQAYKSMSATANRVYVCAITFKTTTASNLIMARVAGTNITSTATTSPQTVIKLVKPSQGGTITIGVRDERTSGWDSIECKWVQFIDLTLAFGSAIADYLYTLESGTAGAGIAKLKEWGFLDKPYYAYDAGSLQSVNVSEHKTTGKNQLERTIASATIGAEGGIANSSSYYCKVARIISGVTYYTDSVLVGYYTSNPSKGDNSYDGTRHSISGSFTAPINGYAVLRYPNSNTEPYCYFVNDSTYEPYTAHTYALDSSLTLRGIPKLDASNNLYYDGDEYTSDGKVVRKYAEDNIFANIAWNYNAQRECWIIDSNSKATLAARIKCPSAATELANVVISGYQLLTQNTFYNGTPSTLPDKAFALSTDGGGYFKDSSITSTSYNGCASVTTALVAVYKKNTPTEETAEGFTSPQICDPNGTEQYTDYGVAQGTRDVAIPVGQNTEYMSDLKTPLEDIVGTIPTADGTYALKVTIASGVPTFSWV